MSLGKPYTIMTAPMAELSHRALRELIIEYEGGSLPPGSNPGSRPVFSATPLECEQNPIDATKRSIAKSWNASLTPLECGHNPCQILYFTEMISAAALISGGPFEQYYLDNGPCPERLVYQLVGGDTGQLTKAAVILDRKDCLGIDLNMGCAAPAITRTGAGVRWMEDPEKAARLVEQIRRITKKQLSAKIRLGPKSAGRAGADDRGTDDSAPASAHVDDTAAEQTIADSRAAALPDFPSLLRFCRRLEEAGLDMITLHPRLAAEKFKRRARWNYVDALRAELTIPVAGNGDITSAAELAEKAFAGPVMAGRLLVREPWTFAGARRVAGSAPAPSSPRPSAPPPDAAPALTLIEETGLRFLELLARHQPPEFHLSRARRFFRYYCDNLVWAEHTRNNINREETLAGIAKVWRAYFQN